MTSKYFPHEQVRPEQDRLIEAVASTIQTKQSLVAHAPTGLGKTAATLAPALELALKNDLVVMFLTGRHTQHQIALETLRDIKKRHAIGFTVVDLIGKQWFCLQPGTEGLRSRAFHEYCKAMKGDKQCQYYENLKEGEQLSSRTKRLLGELKDVTPVTTEEVKAAGLKAGICPYEVTLLLAAKARVIITDYQYLFNQSIRESLLGRLGRRLEECILIVDEAHNLPERIKDHGSDHLASQSINRALAEAEKFKHEELATKIRALGEALQRLAVFRDDRKNLIDGEAERYMSASEWREAVEKIMEYGKLQSWLEKVGDAIREDQRSSAIGAIGDFLKSWEGEDEGYTRILSRERGRQAHELRLSYRCLDPSVISREVFENCHSAVLMSGTLTPPAMYAQLLGVSEPNLLLLESPFPQKNRLNMIVPKTSTKFSNRNEQMWSEIAEIVRRASLAVPGNIAAFFPSYAILDEVHRRIEQGMPKTVLAEQRRMTKEEKSLFLNRFKEYKDHGALLLAVVTGNYGEGIDLPGDLLKGVIIVGLPLSRPDLETKALINYYDAKFRRGWEYGYTVPAFNKALQSAGRCIRSATDKGVILFVDERYEWPRYLKLFPKEWQMRSTLLYEKMIREFFGTAKEGQAATIV